MKLISFISRTLSTKTAKIFNLPGEHRHNSYFKYNNTEYARAYAQWKCSNPKCKNTWESAYTWISFNFLKTNNDLHAHHVIGSTNIREKPFSGSKLTTNDFFQEECKTCGSQNNNIVWYDNLKSSNLDTRKPHKSSLCAKCKLGHYCQLAM